MTLGEASKYSEIILQLHRVVALDCWMEYTLIPVFRESQVFRVPNIFVVNTDSDKEEDFD